ncbi:MAG: hypothetical protein GXX91_09840 [Verrucomicrobiaceae bacterium]|nr:hypothetical protein [Verrucomicrobiaceae bacterium]
MKPTRSRVIEITVVLLVISYPVISEWIYHRDISPGEATHFSEFSGKIRHQTSVRVFEARDGTLFQFRGFGPRAGLLAVPSSTPIYYFDEDGTFAGWVKDPGDMEIPERFQAIGEAEHISIKEAHRRMFGQEKQSHNKADMAIPRKPLEQF